MPRATSAAWLALPPSLVRMPCAAWKPATSSASVKAADEDHVAALAAAAHARRALSTISPLAAPGDAATPRAMIRISADRVERRVQQRVQRPGVDRQHRRLAIEQPLRDGVHGEADRRLRRPLGVARLQHVQAALLDGELGVLHVAVVALERAQDLQQLARGPRASRRAARRGPWGCVLRRRRPRPGRWAGSRRTARERPVSSSREKATPLPLRSPRLPNTICCTFTAVPHSSGMRLMRR